ncbi:hypothetical protein DYB32_003952, partial [Aphanomyces invadans]
LEAAIVSKGNEIRELKAAKADVTAQVAELKKLKTDYKIVAGHEYGASAAAPAAAPKEKQLTKKELRILEKQKAATLTRSRQSADVPKALIKYADDIPRESVIDLYVTVKLPANPITGTTQHNAELSVAKIFTISKALPVLPLQVEDAARSDTLVFAEGSDYVEVGLDTLLDLRTPANQAIMRIQSGVGQLFREFLYSKGFVEIHTPKLLGGASEGGANCFSFGYFGESAVLAQSPQLHKQMACACAGLEKVFEIGPVFRAENSLTARHLCEFTGLDLEMAIKEHYSEHPFEPLKYLNPTLVLKFDEAVAMLQEAGIDQDLLEDLSTPNEKALGALVKEKYGTDFYFLDKFPLAVRPFYTMPDPKDERWSNSYDFMIRGQEILSGAQRVHDPALLVKRMESLGVAEKDLQTYVDAFKFGALPHAGGGVGLERVVMLFLGLGNIRKASMFPRDPVRATSTHLFCQVSFVAVCRNACVREATGPAAHVLSPTSSCNGSIDDDIVDVGDGVELAPVHDDVRDDIICDIFNLPKSTIFYQDFSCALVSTIVYHGRMYPAGDQVCFYSNLFGKETKVLIPYDSIADVSKTSSMFSHGLRIQTTAQKEYSFSSFWGNNRDHCAAIIVALRQKSLGKSSSPFLSIAPQRAPPPPTQGALPVSLASPPSGPISSPSDRPVQASEANVSTAATSAPPALLLTPDEQQHPFTDVAHDTFSVSSDEFVKLFLSDTAIYGIDEANRRRGATDIVCSPWTSDQDGRGRRICCSPTKPSPIFSALADCHFHAARRCPDRAQELSCRCGGWISSFCLSHCRAQKQCRYHVNDTTMHMDTTTKLADIPYGDCFKVDDRFVLTALTPSSCELVIQLRVVFVKSTMWRSLIESRAKTECKQKSVEWIRLAKAAMSPEGLPPWPPGAATNDEPARKLSVATTGVIALEPLKPTRQRLGGGRRLASIGSCCACMARVD